MVNFRDAKPLRTQGEVFLERLEQQQAKVLKLTETPFTEEDITGCIATLGIMIERFLGEIVLPSFRSAYTKRVGFFYDALERLYPGIDINTGKLLTPILTKTEVDALHHLRKRYNDQKHNPSTQILLHELISIYQSTKAAIVSLIDTGVGSLNAKVFESGAIFWIAGTDYIHQGITEVFVYLPLESDGIALPPYLLTFFVKMDGWDRLIQALGRTGAVHRGDDVLTPGQLKLLCDGDALTPRVYNGPLLTLMDALNRASAELVDDKLYNVHELKHRLAPYTTLLLTLDLLREQALTEHLKIGDLTSKVQAALSKMGLQPNEVEEQIEQDVAEVASLIQQLTPLARSRLVGPAWFDSNSYSRLSRIRNIRSFNGSMSISPDLKVMLDTGQT